jgi:hypothetical protein
MLRIGSLLLFLALSGIALSACSFSPDNHSHRTQALPPGVEKIAAVPQAPTAMDTFRALAPPEGMRFTPLFLEPVKDSDARIKRLEDVVQGLRNDFDTVVPSMVRLVAVEKDMKELVAQLQTLTEQPSVPVEQLPPLPSVEKMQSEATLSAPTTAPTAASTIEKIPSAHAETKIPGEDAAGGTETAGIEKAGSKAPLSLVTPEAALKGKLPPEGAASPHSVSPPAQAEIVVPKPAVQPEAKIPASTDQGSVKGVRTGDHADKTRVVLDLTAKAGFTATVSANGKTLIIEIPHMDWAAIKPFDAESAALVAGWHVDGDKLLLDLLYPSKILTKEVLAPNGTPYYRLVVDLFSKDVHR